ncbi:MAG: hypothetical protein LAP40_09050 [Acidobacteriia bacterium]|nr:hypothetical protein [Terriglobia bacterium]
MRLLAFLSPASRKGAGALATDLARTAFPPARYGGVTLRKQICLHDVRLMV